MSTPDIEERPGSPGALRASGGEGGHVGAPIEIDDSPEAVLAEFVKREWCDGLPIVPPTADRVARMLGGRDGTRSLGAFAPMWR